MLVGEIREPGSHRTDSVVKRAEYAAAGIGHYWIIDPHDGPTLTAYRLGGGPGYEDAGSTRDVYDTDDPFRVRIDLAQLVP